VAKAWANKIPAPYWAAGFLLGEVFTKASAGTIAAAASFMASLFQPKI
jgi:hypothetical protein